MNYAKFQVIALNIPEDILSVNYSLLLYAYYQIDLFIGLYAILFFFVCKVTLIRHFPWTALPCLE